MKESLSLKAQKGRVLVLDQTALPQKEKWLDATAPEHMVSAIHSLAVRGAPLIAIAAAFSWANYCCENTDTKKRAEVWQLLKNARPTAVNLQNIFLRLHSLMDAPGEVIWNEAEKVFDEDLELCQKMAQRGSVFIQDGDQIITHCNTGGLATAGMGTALGVIKYAHEEGKKIHVFVDETRPLLQGARLTAWELERWKIPYTLICDSMAAALMAQKKVDKVFVGADRIAVNGDVANKIGTYSLAVNAKYHQVPFFVVAPETTYDPACPTGKDIPIEERMADEVRAGKSPINASVWNPAFDVTPRALITEIILDTRLF